MGIIFRGGCWEGFLISLLFSFPIVFFPSWHLRIFLAFFFYVDSRCTETEQIKTSKYNPCFVFEHGRYCPHKVWKESTYHWLRKALRKIIASVLSVKILIINFKLFYLCESLHLQSWRPSICLQVLCCNASKKRERYWQLSNYVFHELIKLRFFFVMLNN